MSDNWFTGKLQAEAKQVLKNAYAQNFTDEEVFLMCQDLVNLFEIMKNQYENNQFGIQKEA